jgi:hypothetical protein
MDQPSELHCFACKAFLGLSCESPDYWTCACGKRVRPTANGTREATPEYLTLVQELDALKRRFDEESEGFTLRVGGSRISPGHRVAPDQVDAGCEAVMIVLVIGGLGTFALVHGGYIFGPALIVISIGLAIFVRKDNRRRIAGYRILKAEYDRERVALERRLSDT